MTSLTDEQLLGELGWTAQIISDITGGYIPAYWVSQICFRSHLSR